MSDEQNGGGGYSGMPKWPKEARDVPEPYRPGGGGGGGEYPIVGLVVGLVIGGLPLIESLRSGGLAGPEGAGRVVGWLAIGAFGAFVGHMLARRRSRYDR